MSKQSIFLLVCLILAAVHVVVSLALLIKSAESKNSVQVWFWAISLCVCAALVVLVDLAYMKQLKNDKNSACR